MGRKRVLRQSRYHEAAEKRSLFAAFRQLGRTQDKERNEREKKENMFRGRSADLGHPEKCKV